MKKTLILTIILTTIWSCQSDRKFPELKNLSDYKETEFLPTLENTISKDKNSVYCATLLFAWEEIRKSIKTPLEIDKMYPNLILFNSSKSHVNTLESSEYETSAKIENEKISLSAEFEKSLPFVKELTSFTDKLLFNQTKVASFGIICNEDETYENIEILYYKNDDEFVLKLSLRNTENEIILYKSKMKFQLMSEIISEINKNIIVGKNEVNNDAYNWKYNLCDKDEVIVPKLSFNIETNFSNLENNSFNSGGQLFNIETVKQRTAFLLDEKGAEIKSKSFFEAVAVDEPMTYEAPRPKKLIFDKPFFLMIRKTDNINPYLALLIKNTELMMKK